MQGNTKQSSRRLTPLFVTLTILILCILGFKTIQYYSKDDVKVETYSEDRTLSLYENIVDWKTYRNDKNGIEFKYPSDLKVKETSYQTGEFYIGLTREFISDPNTYDYNFSMGISSKRKYDKESLDRFFTREYCETIEQSAYTPNRDQAISECKELFSQTKKSLQIDGRNAIQANNISYVVGNLITVVDNNSEFTIFSLGESGEEGAGISDKALKTFGQILSTVKLKN